MIKTVIYPKQEKAFYNALESGDMYAAHIFYIPPIYRSLESIKADMRLEELCRSHEAEMKRIEETPNDILRLEIEMKLGIKKEYKPIRKTFLQRLFRF